jgi:hypothetical protein
MCLLSQPTYSVIFFPPVKYLDILQTLRDLIDWESHQDFGIRTEVDILRFDLLDVNLCALFIDDRIVYYL